MKTAIYSYINNQLAKHPDSHAITNNKVQLILCFGSKSLLQEKEVFQLLKQEFTNATIATCSTSGEIFHTSVKDDSLSVIALEFSHTTIQSHSVLVDSFDNSFDAGSSLIQTFVTKDLAYVLVLSDGSKVNGSELVRGMNKITDQKILVTGGLAGDGSNFTSTLVGLNDNAREGLIIAIGFYGDKIKIGHGSKGGWEMFGLSRLVTKSSGNILYEVDHKNALELYKQYLGPEADSLPGSALLFPLAVELPDSVEPIVRTILSIDEVSGSMTFAGDIPVGSKVRFMRANFDKLTNAASGAALQAQLHENNNPSFALLISCVGRKLILQSRTEEEVEAVNEIFTNKTILGGFYSYGEISPLSTGSNCQLHNQTMTITTFDETE